MSKSIQRAETRAENRQQHAQRRQKSVDRSSLQNETNQPAALTQSSPDMASLSGGGSVAAQAQVLRQFDGAQQRQAIQRIGMVQGNRHLQRLITAYNGSSGGDKARTAPAGAVQAKLSVSEPGDAYEQEADQVAARVMRMSPTTASPQPEEEDSQLGAQAPALQASNQDTPNISADVETRIQSMKGAGAPLPDTEKGFFEDRFGADFGNVRVHNDDAAAQTSKDLSARAYTVGSDVAFGEGEYEPGTDRGRELMAHELTHVVQQGGAGAPKGQVATSRIQRADNHRVTTTEGVNESKRSVSAGKPGEVVIMSGGPTSNVKDPGHDDNPVNFLTTARTRIEGYIASAFANRQLMGPDDRIVWVVMRPPYIYRAEEDGEKSNAYLDLVNTRLPKLQAYWDNLRAKTPGGKDAELGQHAISVHFVDTEENFVKYINQGSASVGGKRAMPVKRFEFFGHGAPGELTFMNNWGHKMKKGGDVRFSIEDIAKLNPEAFAEDAEFRSWACNTATPKGTTDGRYGKVGKGKVFSEEWVKRLGGRFVSPFGRTSYYESYKGKVGLSDDYYGGKQAYWTTTEATDFGEAKGGNKETPNKPVKQSESKTVTSDKSKQEIPVQPKDEKDDAPPGTGKYVVEEFPVTGPDANLSPNPNDPKWQPILQGLAKRAYAETFETDDIPNTLSSVYNIGKAVKSHAKGFRVQAGARNGVKYWRVKGSHGGIKSGWYPVKNSFTPSSTSAKQLSQIMSPTAAMRAGALSKSNAALTVVGDVLDYAIDPEKEFGSDFAVDLSFDLVKAAGSSAAGGFAGGAVSSLLAGGALGATLGSAAPVIGTVVGFIVGILVAMAIEYFIEDYRAGLKAYFNRKPGSSWVWPWERGSTK